MRSTTCRRPMRSCSTTGTPTPRAWSCATAFSPTRAGSAALRCARSPNTPPAPTRKFIAAASGRFYDISVAGAAGPPRASGFSSDAWQWTPFLSRLFFVNGTDPAQVYDGTSFANAGFTGVALASLAGVTQYQQRLLFWQSNSTGFWFAPLNAISGALSFYDLAAFAPHGGNLVAATTVSHDGGNGVVDLIAFIMSSGDCLIYFGNDPGNANAWSLVGIYRISPPVSPRAVCQYGAEAFITTYDDHIPLQQQLVALKLGQLPPRSKISTAVANAVRANLTGFGWQALYYPRGRRLIFNIPNPDGTFCQHVQNTALQSQPWCRFTNMNAYCWGLFRDNLFFGAAGGAVFAADTGNLDNLGAVAANAQQAWNTFANPMRKRITAVRPMVQAPSCAELQLRARLRLRRHRHCGHAGDRKHRRAVGFIAVGQFAVVARQRGRSALAGGRRQRAGDRRAHARERQLGGDLAAHGLSVRTGSGAVREIVCNYNPLK